MTQPVVQFLRSRVLSADQGPRLLQGDGHHGPGRVLQLVGGAQRADDGGEEVRIPPHLLIHVLLLTFMSPCVHRPLKAQLQAELATASTDEDRESISHAFASREKALEHDLDHKPMGESSPAHKHVVNFEHLVPCALALHAPFRPCHCADVHMEIGEDIYACLVSYTLSTPYYCTPKLTFFCPTPSVLQPSPTT